MAVFRSSVVGRSYEAFARQHSEMVGDYLHPMLIYRSDFNIGRRRRWGSSISNSAGSEHEVEGY